MQNVLNRMDIFQKELLKNGFSDHSDRVQQKKNDYKEKFMLMVIGEGNYGKSTLINSLFNKEVAAVSRLPRTWKIDIYENSNKKEALLYYKNISNPKVICIEDAIKTCEKEENISAGNSLWKSDLFQVKWRINSDWLDNILLIDTPGFSQFRSGTTYNNFNLFGTKGIQFEALDGFEYYLYRADFIFWCIKATKLEDSDTLNALKNINSEKANIIGIITFMERVPLERWEEIKSKAEEIFGSFIKDFYFFSPKVIKDTNGNINTIDEIRSYINSEIIHNLEKFKKSNLINFYNEELSNYSHSMDKTSEVYDNNISKYLELRDEIKNNYDMIFTRIESAQRNIFLTLTQPIKNTIISIYDRSNNDISTFKRTLENEVINHKSVQQQIERIYSLTNNEISNMDLDINRKISWRSLTISNKKTEIDRSIMYPRREINSNKFGDSIKLKIDINSYFDTAFNADTFGNFIFNLAAGIFSLIAGNKKRKYVDMAYEEVMKYFSKLNSNLEVEVKNIILTNVNLLVEKLDDSFKEFNGGSKDELLNNFYQTDSVLANKLLFNDKNSVIDCYKNNGRHYLIYYPKLLKHDTYRYNKWNQNADLIFVQEVKSLLEKIYKEISDIENFTKKLIVEQKLDNPELFKQKFEDMRAYLNKGISRDSTLANKVILDQLVYCNGEKVFNTNNAFNIALNEAIEILSENEKDLELLWDQKVLNLIWNNCKSDISRSLLSEESRFSSLQINQYCRLKAKIVSKKIYIGIINSTDIYAQEYSVDIYSHDIINSELKPEMLQEKDSFYSILKQVINKKDKLSKLKTAKVTDVAKIIAYVLTERIRKIIRQAPLSSSFNKKYKRNFGVLYLYAIMVIITYTLTFLFPLHILLIVISSITILLVFLIIFSIIIPRSKMKKDIERYIVDEFMEYGENLSRNIQNITSKGILIRRRYKGEE